MAPVTAQLTPKQLIEVVQRDRRERWQKGERVLVETYLQRYPTLQTDPEHILDLIYHEILLREELDETPKVEEYQQRFPKFTSRLERLFVVHRAIEEGTLCLPSSTQMSQHTMPLGTGDTMVAELPTV